MSPYLVIKAFDREFKYVHILHNFRQVIQNITFAHFSVRKLQTELPNLAHQSVFLKDEREIQHI